MLETVIITVAGSIINSLIVTVAFVIIGRTHATVEDRHAEERRRAMNAALSNSTPEFLARQRATEPAKETSPNKGEPIVQLDL